MRWVLAVAIALIGLALPSRLARAEAAAPSFDCHRASLADERAICADDRLAEMDRTIAAAMSQIGKDDKKPAHDSAAAALKDRHACGATRLCILDSQLQLLDDLRDDGATIEVPDWAGAYRLGLVGSGAVPVVAGLPRKVGTCTRTKILGIGTRFGDKLKPSIRQDRDEGTSVDYVNDGHQVSYSYDAAVGQSAVGDEVLLCLVSLPKDCPPGDDRGRVYSATNVRTKGSWIMADSQHMCGGA